MGGAKLEAVKSFVAKGRTRRLQGNNLLAIEFGIACELPDKLTCERMKRRRRRAIRPRADSTPTS
jgi:hypothetical protein